MIIIVLLLIHDSEVAYQLQNSEAKLLLTHPAAAETAVRAANKVGLPKSSIYTFIDPDDDLPTSSMRNWTDFWCDAEEAGSWSWRKIKTIEEAQGTTAIINYSSGYVSSYPECDETNGHC